MTDNKNTLIAIVLSALVLIGWQYFVGLPQMEKQRQEAALKQQQTVPAAQPQNQTQAQPAQTQPGTAPQPGGQTAPNVSTAPPAPGTAPQVPGQGGAATPAQAMTREQVVAASPRIALETPRLRGSISLKGGRLDDLSLNRYRETVKADSQPIVLLSPSGSPHPFYAEFGWSAPGVKLPDSNTLWTQVGSGPLNVDKPVTLSFDNGEGLEFRRTINIDDKYLFTLKDEVINKGTAPVTLHPYGLVSRHGTPKVEGYYILHEGMIGVLGDKGLQEVTYAKIEEQKTVNFDVQNGWLGITDKYWAATLLPDADSHLKARFSSGLLGTTKTYQTDYLLDGVTVAPGATGSTNARLFAGAKEVAIVGLEFPLVGIGGYNTQLNLNHFDLLIDWGWFYFITKPMFLAMDFFFHLFGNFGLAILMVTVLIKIIFFPLSNKSYASMAKMKAVQPEMTMIRERYADDRVKQQQAMMELYKKEKINPLAGCLPIAVQIPVFFSLYKVLFVTIEMRHAPFFGWILDLSAPDPTNLFNLFGLIPYDPTLLPVIGHFLHIGVWPLIMGVTMWVQMKLNPSPPDPTQKLIFDWMPLIFTFMLASFSAGLVIYWAWNNTLSVLQQSVIMKRNGAKIELFDNLRDTGAAIKRLLMPKKPSA